ncbi:hypothetical protein [Limosilactobacillus caecicola]|uniref:hypothetical protein n=1 Tax=Limosilactobacillus caecicola TaxID=2941332 RepID=UPI00203F3D0E|nr:hypothetical protein [Limosilactobacillus caecicola]
METYITNLHGVANDNQEAQNIVTNIACNDLNYREFGIYRYNWDGEPDDILDNRIDGIIASLAKDDTVIMQFPASNNQRWDNRFIDHLNAYQANIIILIQDLPSQRGRQDKQLLQEEIQLFNRADAVIAPSQQMLDFLIQNGLTITNTTTLELFDFPAQINSNRKPAFQQTVNYWGPNPHQDDFRKWSSQEVNLQIFAKPSDWGAHQNVTFTNHFVGQELADNLHNAGGFGLLWETHPAWQRDYTYNPTLALSVYLSAGLPVIVPANLSCVELIKANHLGVVVNSFAEIPKIVQKMSDDDYTSLLNAVDQYAVLIRNGWLTKRALIRTVFNLFA